MILTQEFWIVVIGIAVLLIAAYRLYRYFRYPDPCAGCSCALKKEMRQRARRAHKQRKSFVKDCTKGGLGLLLLLFSACADRIVTDTQQVNHWIYRQMQQNYLFEEDMLSENSCDFSLPPDRFFQSLLSVREKRSGRYLSYIEKDPAQTRSAAPFSLNDDYGMGLVVYVSASPIVAQVCYVYKGGVAYKAGIRRGDWIYKVNGADIEKDRYDQLMSGNGLSVSRAVYENGGLVPFDRVEIPAAVAYPDEAILEEKVLTVDGKKIAYLCYMNFVAGTVYEDDLRRAFASFKQAGVSELILDLRYNGGGIIDVCRQLSSYIAPASVQGKLFCSITYNNRQNRTNQLYFLSDQETSAFRLNLSRLFVLTTVHTASASELLISALRPYYGESNVILIGEKTFGKNMGSFGISDSRFLWSLHPLSFYVFNSEGWGDYAEGIAPLNENLLKETSQQMLPLGDPNELLVSRAIDRITGKANVNPAPRLMKYREKVVPLQSEVRRIVPNSGYNDLIFEKNK